MKGLHLRSEHSVPNKIFGELVCGVMRRFPLDVSQNDCLYQFLRHDVFQR